MNPFDSTKEAMSRILAVFAVISILMAGGALAAQHEGHGCARTSAD